MAKVKPKKVEESALIAFKTEKQKKFFFLMLFDFVLLGVILLIAPSIGIMIIISIPLFYLLFKHIKGYHFAIKEGDKS